jgi:hypothetical protein
MIEREGGGLALWRKFMEESMEEDDECLDSRALYFHRVHLRIPSDQLCDIYDLMVIERRENKAGRCFPHAVERFVRIGSLALDR